MRFKILHLLSCPDHERERISVMSISGFARECGIEYVRIINEPYRWPLPPAADSLRPDELYVEDPDIMKSSLGKYGCYRAHKDALREYMTCDLDGILLFECDAYIYYENKALFEAIKVAQACCSKLDLDMFTFGVVFRLKDAIIRRISNLYLTDYIRQTHAIFIPNSAFLKVRDVFDNGKWDTIDYFYSRYLDRFAGFIKPLCMQIQGDSLLDGSDNERLRSTKIKVVLEENRPAD
jgi:hypothetical protein